MNKTLKLSLLGTLATSSTLAVALPAVSCASTEKEATKTLTPEVEKANVDFVKSEYKKQMESKSTHELQESLYNSWIEGEVLTEATSPSFDNLKTTITFKNSNGKDVPWDDAVQNLTYGSKETFPTKKGDKIPSIKIKANVKNDLIVSNESLLTIEITDLGVVADKAVILVITQNTMLGLNVIDDYRKAIGSLTTYEEQKALYNSWTSTITSSNSPSNNINSILSIRTSTGNPITPSSRAIDKWVYETKPFFPSGKDKDLPPVTIRAVLKEEYVTSTPNQLRFTISNYGKVVSDPAPGNISVTPTINVAKVNEVKAKYKESIQKDLTTHAQQKAVYDTWATNAILTNTNSPAFTELKQTITFKDNSGKNISWDDAVKNLTYGTKASFPISIGNKIPNITIKVNVKSHIIISNESLLTITIDDLGNVVANALKRIHISYAGSNFTQVVVAYQGKINPPSLSYTQQKASYDSWVSNVTLDNMPDKSLELYTKLTVNSLMVKDESGNTLNQFAVIEKWIYETKPAFPEGKDKPIPSLFITAVLKPEYVNTNSAFSLTYEIKFTSKTH